MRAKHIGPIAIIFVTLTAAPALAGGAVWELDDYYPPGDVVESATGAAWGHNPDLGTPSDGPFFVYMAKADDLPSSWPGVGPRWMLVGLVEIVSSDRNGYATAIARFEIPDVPAGSYQLYHCNDPCTTTLGDVIGSWPFRVLEGTAGRPASVVAEEVRAELFGPVGDGPRSGDDRAWIITTSAVGLLIVVTLFKTWSVWNTQMEPPLQSRGITNTRKETAR
jgi:hypothetical protein